MLDTDSLDQALDGVSALITTAQGNMGRRNGDSLATVDDRGNRNLIDAAERSASLKRFVFTSVLSADKAPTVPQFWQKKIMRRARLLGQRPARRGG
ncbi:MAG: NAD(P)H-binding protein [Actinomycetota bacterium]|nr:NAD(P)H-binding protein [Actinomycetota bacterium]